MENGENCPAMVTEENLRKTEEGDSETQEEVKDKEAVTNISSVKRRKKKNDDNDSSKEPITPTSERPSRERKSIERFSNTIEKEKTKELKIVKVCDQNFWQYLCGDFRVYP
mgnify:CR=1 FL=1